MNTGPVKRNMVYLNPNAWIALVFRFSFLYGTFRLFNLAKPPESCRRHQPKVTQQAIFFCLLTIQLQNLL